MKDVNDLIREVRGLIDQPGWTINRLASEAGLHRSTLAGIDLPQKPWRPRADILQKCVEVARSSFPASPDTSRDEYPVSVPLKQSAILESVNRDLNRVVEIWNDQD